MTVAETLLVYVGAPLLVVIVLAALTYLPGARKKSRWKSGSSWDHEPVWYEPHPEHPEADAHGAPAFGAAVSGSGTQAIGSSLYGEPTDGDGSHAESAGATAASTPAVTAGPLGGARGTW